MKIMGSCDKIDEFYYYSQRIQSLK